MNESLFIIFIAFAGFCLSSYLRHKKKRTSEHLVCPFRGNCTEVIHSRYGSFFGIPVELLGFVYYAAMAIGYGITLIWNSPISNTLSILLFLASTFAVVFSFYLTFIQLVTLKKICTWCLLSAMFCLSIFLLALQGSSEEVIPLLFTYRNILSTLHVLAMAFGLCASTFSDIFFFKFLQDNRISAEETSILHTFSQTIWLALGMMIMTGLGLYLPEIHSYNASPAFLLEVIAIVVILINGSFLNLFVAPKFSTITSGDVHEHQEGELRKTKHLVFILGPISLISWYVAFLLDTLNPKMLSFEDGVVYFFLLIVVGIYLAHILECQLDERLKSKQCAL